MAALLQALPLAHGFFSANDYGVSIVDDSVADGISQQWVRQLFRPARNVKLGAENRGVSLVPGLHDFQEVPGFRFFQRVQKPFVNKSAVEKLGAQVIAHYFPQKVLSGRGG